MDLECKLKRDGGTKVTIGNKEYHFQPRDDGAHVATVADEAHQDIFLGIPEAYGPYRGKAAAPKAVASQKPAITDPVEAAKNTGGAPGGVDILLGSGSHPASFDIHGKTYSLGEVVAMAHTQSGLDVAEWNELAEDSRAGLIDEQLDQLQDAGPVADDREALVAQYVEKFGKKPHHALGIDKLRAALAEG